MYCFRDSFCKVMLFKGFLMFEIRKNLDLRKILVTPKIFLKSRFHCIDFFLRLVKWPKIDVKKCQNLIFKVDFQRQKSFESFQKKNFLKNINLGATFLFLSILCSIKIVQLLFLKFLKNLAFFDSYFWPFNKTHEKIIAIFVISAIMASIWNVFIKFRWHDEKLTTVYQNSPIYTSILHAQVLNCDNYLCSLKISRDKRHILKMIE